jgi:hypothetical protein
MPEIRFWFQSPIAALLMRRLAQKWRTPGFIGPEPSFDRLANAPTPWIAPIAAFWCFTKLATFSSHRRYSRGREPYERHVSKHWRDIDEQDEADATCGNDGNDG